MVYLPHQIRPSTLYYGDCLEVMREWSPEQADLIYLDPPFNSKTQYNILFGDKTNGKTAQLMAFDDTWQWDGAAAERVKTLKGMKASNVWKAIAGLETCVGETGMLAYLSYMAERLMECHRLLKPTGSIYLHCDPTASHYLKMLMDSLFGAGNFKNEIIWYYKNASRGKKQFAKAHDVIFWYEAKRKKAVFNRDDMLVPFESGMTKWRYETGGQRNKPMPEGKTPDDVLVLSALNANDKTERLGYPTQKPVELLEHIIKASSNEGDLVLDPFCGCGTTVVGAQRLNRQWAGIDISAFAVESVMKRRLEKYGIKAETEGIPVDFGGAEALAAKSGFKFEIWAVHQVPGLAPNSKQVGDKGVDGRGTLTFESTTNRDAVIAQVKAGKANAGQLRDFLYTMTAEDAVAGVFITLRQSHATKGMRQTAAAEGTYRIKNDSRDYPRVQFWSIEEWIRSGKDGRFLPNLPPMIDPLSGKPIQRTLYEQHGLSSAAERTATYRGQKTRAD